MSVVPWQAHQRFGQYVLVRPIAIGGMAEVWHARLDGPQGFEKKVAIKRMTASLAEQPTFVAMFLDEARLMASLTHPNICQVFELGQRDDNFYVAMEYIAGQTIHSVMRMATRKQHKVPLDLTVKIIRDAADALAYAHNKADETGRPLNIIHRDVSPQNIMVTYDGLVKLLDFGIAKAATRTVATETGQLKGKMSYMPPEQARGEELDPRADQFALGVTLFEMVTHTRLYPVMKEMDLFREVATGETPYPDPRSREPQVPEELAAIVTRMMRRQRDERFASMAEVRDRLTQVLLDLSNSLPKPEALAVFMRFTFPPEQREQEVPTALATDMEPNRLSGTSATPTSNSAGSLDIPVEALQPRPLRRAAPVLAVVGALVLAALGWALLRSPAPSVESHAAVGVPAVEVDAGASALVPPKLPSTDEPSKDLMADAGVASIDLASEPSGDEGKGDEGKGDTKRRKAKGRLSLQTTPWTIVYLGKKSLGETPLVNVSLPAGKHRLRLVNEEKKLSTTIEVEIAPGKTTTKRLQF